MFIDLVTKQFSGKIFEEAYKQAERSTLRNFKTGAVVFMGEDIYLKGCSHTILDPFEPLASVHAEAHCIQLARKLFVKNQPLDMFVLAIGKTGNPAFSSKPCLSCVRNLDVIPVRYVYYLERLNSGQWILNVKSPIDLLSEAETSELRLDRYAKNMRIK